MESIVNMARNILGLKFRDFKTVGYFSKIGEMENNFVYLVTCPNMGNYFAFHHLKPLA